MQIFCILVVAFLFFGIRLVSSQIYCPPGSFSNGAECIQCKTGTYGTAWGYVGSKNACYLCATGTFASERGMSQCTLCAAGSYSTSVYSCYSCPIGSYSNQSKSTSCISCEGGVWPNTTGATTCSTETTVPPETSSTSQPTTFPETTPLPNTTEVVQSNEFNEYCNGIIVQVAKDFSVFRNQNLSVVLAIFYNTTSDNVVYYYNETEPVYFNNTDPNFKTLDGIFEARIEICRNENLLDFYDDKLFREQDSVLAELQKYGISNVFLIEEYKAIYKHCPMGTKRHDEYTANCSLCPVGTYAPSIDSLVCLDCVWATSPGAKNCIETANTLTSNKTMEFEGVTPGTVEPTGKVIELCNWIGLYSLSSTQPFMNTTFRKEFADFLGATNDSFQTLRLMEQPSVADDIWSLLGYPVGTMFTSYYIEICRGGYRNNNVAISYRSKLMNQSENLVNRLLAIGFGKLIVLGIDGLYGVDIYGRNTLQLLQDTVVAGGPFIVGLDNDFTYNPHCLAGSIKDPYSYECIICYAGTYSSAADQSQCSKCASGQYTTSMGSSACTSCSPGTIAHPYGPYLPCINCNPGSYASAFGLTVCQLCAAGSYSSVSGASACLNCVTASTAGQSTC